MSVFSWPRKLTVAIMMASTAPVLPTGMLPVSCEAFAAPKAKKRKEVEPLFPSSRRETLPKPGTAEDGATNPDQSGFDPKRPAQQIRGILGLASGLGHVSSAVFVLGGDYVRGLRPNLDVVGGMLRWNNLYSDSTYSIDHAVTTFDGGVEYRLPLRDGIAFKGTGRLGLAISSAATEDIVIGQPESQSSTITAFVATVGGSVLYTRDRFQFGAELRKPIFFAELQDEGTITYLLGTVSYTL